MLIFLLTQVFRIQSATTATIYIGDLEVPQNQPNMTFAVWLKNSPGSVTVTLEHLVHAEEGMLGAGNLTDDAVLLEASRLGLPFFPESLKPPSDAEEPTRSKGR